MLQSRWACIHRHQDHWRHARRQRAASRAPRAVRQASGGAAPALMLIRRLRQHRRRRRSLSRCVAGPEAASTGRHSSKTSAGSVRCEHGPAEATAFFWTSGNPRSNTARSSVGKGAGFLRPSQPVCQILHLGTEWLSPPLFFRGGRCMAADAAAAAGRPAEAAGRGVGARHEAGPAPAAAAPAVRRRSAGQVQGAQGSGPAARHASCNQEHAAQPRVGRCQAQRTSAQSAATNGRYNFQGSTWISFSRDTTARCQPGVEHVSGGLPSTSSKYDCRSPRAPRRTPAAKQRRRSCS